MSDDDFMQESDPEQYDFDYEDDDDGPNADIDVENKYYNAKQLKSSNPEEAIDEFLGVPSLEPEKGNWGFKGLKQAIKLEFNLGRYGDAVKHYCELLTYVKSAVTRNYSEKSINNLLDFVEKQANAEEGRGTVEQFYSKTLESFKANNERLWLKTNLKLARLWVDRGLYEQVAKNLRELHRFCQNEDGTDDASKGTYSLEIYALEIQTFSALKNHKRLKALYEQALKVRSAIPHPRIMGVIRECGGKMHMTEENWKAAQTDFFESFRNYDEAGSLQRIQVLKYLVLTTMLVESDINPFDSPETKPYKNDPRIAAMTQLVDAYQSNNLHQFEEILRKNHEAFSDPFIAENIDEVTQHIRSRAMLQLVKPYVRFRLEWAAKELGVSEEVALDTLSVLMISGKFGAKVDRATNIVAVTENDSPERWDALREWDQSLNALWAHTFVKRDGRPPPERKPRARGRGGHFR